VHEAVIHNNYNNKNNNNKQHISKFKKINSVLLLSPSEFRAAGVIATLSSTSLAVTRAAPAASILAAILVRLAGWSGLSASAGACGRSGGGRRGHGTTTTTGIATIVVSARVSGDAGGGKVEVGVGVDQLVVAAVHAFLGDIGLRAARLLLEADVELADCSSLAVNIHLLEAVLRERVEHVLQLEVSTIDTTAVDTRSSENLLGQLAQAGLDKLEGLVGEPRVGGRIQATARAMARPLTTTQNLGVAAAQRIGDTLLAALQQVAVNALLPLVLNAALTQEGVDPTAITIGAVALRPQAVKIKRAVALVHGSALVAVDLDLAGAIAAER